MTIDWGQNPAAVWRRHRQVLRAVRRIDPIRFEDLIEVALLDDEYATVASGPFDVQLHRLDSDVLQATEALKLILGLGQSLSGRLLHFDALAMRFRETRLSPDPTCTGCGAGRGAAPVTVPGVACRTGPG